MILLLAMAQAAKPPAATLTQLQCSAPGIKQPPLMLLDQKGKCQKDYQAMKGPDGKPRYCVLHVFPQPVKCTTGPPPPPPKAPAKAGTK